MSEEVEKPEPDKGKKTKPFTEATITAILISLSNIVFADNQEVNNYATLSAAPLAYALDYCIDLLIDKGKKRKRIRRREEKIKRLQKSKKHLSSTEIQTIDQKIEELTDEIESIKYDE